MAVSDTTIFCLYNVVLFLTRPLLTNLQAYSNTKIELGDDKDVPIASASQLGVIKVGTNLDIHADGTLSAVIPAGLNTKDPGLMLILLLTDLADGHFWIWDGADATLNNAAWGTLMVTLLVGNDRLFYTTVKL